MDYLSRDLTLMFRECEEERCVNVSIVDDLEDEPEESFFFILERTPDLHPNITLDPAIGEIFIVDNDG